MATIRIRNVTKSYGETEVLSNVSLDISDGEFIALLGPSGCGKTTLLRIIAGLEQPDSGSIWIGDRDVTQLDPTDRNIAFVFQSYALYPHKSVYENIAFPLRMKAPWTTRIPFISKFFPQRRLLEKEIRPQVENVSKQVGIQPYLDRKPAALSGGQRQRVALARSLVRQPVVFLMDEPLSNLDAKLRASMRVDISELQRRLQATFVYVTHDQVEAMTMADRIALMNDKVIQQMAPPLTLYENPTNRFVAEFIGSPAINILQLAQSNDGLITLCANVIQNVPTPVKAVLAENNNEILLGVRPDFLKIVPSNRTGILCTVRLIEPLGNDAFLAVTIDVQASGQPQDQRVVVRIDPQDAENYSVGQKLLLTPQWDNIFCFTPDGRKINLGVKKSPIINHPELEAV